MTEKMLEVVGPDGKVHYRRLEGYTGDTVLEEAAKTPGYTIRKMGEQPKPITTEEIERLKGLCEKATPIEDEVKSLYEALDDIREYWNGSCTEGAMSNALDHILEVVDRVLTLPKGMTDPVVAAREIRTAFPTLLDEVERLNRLADKWATLSRLQDELLVWYRTHTLRKGEDMSGLYAKLTEARAALGVK